MNILFALGHPAHYHLFKTASNSLKKKGHQIHFIITPKDILGKLLESNNENFSILAEKENNEKLSGKFKKFLKSTISLNKIAKAKKADLLVGCLSQIAFSGRILGIPSIFVGEDDFSCTWMQGMITYPFVNCILAPNVTNIGPFRFKKSSYEGYHELAYLHPNHFTPDKSIVKKYFNPDENYFLIRFAKLTAHHDSGIQGINDRIAVNLIKLLEPHGKIFITSEREFHSDLEPYRININPIDMHHIMAFSNLYIGDSQTMAAEVAVLGTPFIRFNDFVGRISYLEELENKYQLGFGIKSDNENLLYEKVKFFLSQPNIKDTYSERRLKMLKEKIDVEAFLVWFIENYPQSKKIIKKDPSYQYHFN